MSDTIQTVRQVVEALAPLTRRAGSDQEREAAEWIADRFESAGVPASIDEEEIMATSAFRQALEEAIAQRHSAVHPFSDAWMSGRLSKPLLGEWVKQHYHYVSHFSEWLATIYGDCPHEDVREFLLENITEEELTAFQTSWKCNSTPCPTCLWIYWSRPIPT